MDIDELNSETLHVVAFLSRKSNPHNLKSASQMSSREIPLSPQLSKVRNKQLSTRKS